MSTCVVGAFRMATLDMRNLDTSLDMRDTNLPTSTRVPTPSIRDISQAGTLPVATWARRIKIQHAQHISSVLGEALHGPRRVESRLWSFHECAWQLVPLNVHGSWHLVVVTLQCTQLCTRLCTQLHVKKRVIRREREQRPCVYRWTLFRRSQNWVLELCSPVSCQKERDSRQIDWKIPTVNSWYLSKYMAVGTLLCHLAVYPTMQSTVQPTARQEADDQKRERAETMRI